MNVLGPYWKLRAAILIGIAALALDHAWKFADATIASNFQDVKTVELPLETPWSYYDRKLREETLRYELDRYSKYIDSNDIESMVDWLIIAEEETGVASQVLLAVMKVESTFKPESLSSVGAVGYMQIVPKYWEDKYPCNIYDQFENIVCGAYILKHYNDRCKGDWTCTFGAYNVGIGAYLRNDNVSAVHRYLNKMKRYLTLSSL